MIYQPNGRNPLPAVVEILKDENITECELRMVVAHFKASGITPESNNDLIKLLEEIRNLSHNYYSFTNAISILKEKDIFNG